MIVDLTDTTAGAIAAALVQARHSAGVPAIGMVLTLHVVGRLGLGYGAVYWQLVRWANERGGACVTAESVVHRWLEKRGEPA